MTLTKEQIEQAADFYYCMDDNMLSNGRSFVVGAEWAQSKLLPIIEAQDDVIEYLGKCFNYETQFSTERLYEFLKKIEEAKNGL